MTKLSSPEPFYVNIDSVGCHCRYSYPSCDAYAIGTLSRPHIEIAIAGQGIA